MESPQETAGADNLAPAATGNMRSDNKKLLTTVIIAFAVTIIAGGGVFAWRYFFSSGEETEDTETGIDVDKNAEPERELFDEDGEEESEEENEDDESGSAEDAFESFPGMFDEDEYSSQHYVCDGAGGPVSQYYFDLWYPTDFVTVHEGIGYAVADPDCDVELHYEDNILYVRYNVSNDILAQIEPGYEILKSEAGKTMVRTETLENGGDYVFSYVWMIDDADCVPSPDSPGLAPPCAHGFHPFMPATTLVQAVVPGDTGASELGDIIDLFDDMAILMEGGEM